MREVEPNEPLDGEHLFSYLKELRELLEATYSEEDFSAYDIVEIVDIQAFGYMARGYILGIHDAYNEELFDSKNAILGQLRDIVFKYLKSNPKERHELAGDIVIKALQEAFPIKNKKK